MAVDDQDRSTDEFKHGDRVVFTSGDNEGVEGIVSGMFGWPGSMPDAERVAVGVSYPGGSSLCSASMVAHVSRPVPVVPVVTAEMVCGWLVAERVRLGVERLDVSVTAVGVLAHTHTDPDGDGPPRMIDVATWSHEPVPPQPETLYAAGYRGGVVQAWHQFGPNQDVWRTVCGAMRRRRNQLIDPTPAPPPGDRYCWNSGCRLLLDEP